MQGKELVAQLESYCHREIVLLPWAKVRMARFLAAHTGVSVVGGLDGLLGDVTPQGGALGDAFTDLQAIELGLPI